MIEVQFRPIDVWPGKLRTDEQRSYSPFTAGWQNTLNLLDRELRALKAKRIVVQIACRDNDIRVDGRLKESAKVEHPGATVAFESKFGPLKYTTDVFKSRWGVQGWQANVRAIGLALRAVDRYGVTRRGEQYQGWKALPSGVAMPEAMGIDEAAVVIVAESEAYFGEEWISAEELAAAVRAGDPEGIVKPAVREALKHAHPDQGGTPNAFVAVNRARDVFKEAP